MASQRRTQAGPLPRAAAGALAGALVVASGCGLLRPTRTVDRQAPPPVEVARAAAAAEASAAASASAAGAATGPAAPDEAAPGREAAPAPEPRSLADLVDLALTRDPTTRAAWQDARAAAAQAGGRRSLWLPGLGASAELDRSRVGGTPGRPVSTETRASVGASISWLLVDLTRGALIDEGDRLAAAARLGEHAAVADLVLRVQETYFQLLAARALVEAEGAAVRQAETSLSSAEGRREAGVATIADVLQARTALSQVRLALQQVEGQALSLRGALATLAGLPPTAALEVGVLPARVDTRPAEPAIEELLARASARNPDVTRAEALADAAAARARATARAAWPVLSLQAGAGRSWPVTDDGLGGLGDATTTWSAGLSLTLPPFNGLRPAYEALAARASADAARARADATGQRVALDVWTSFQDLRTASNRVETARDLLESATASADVARGRYQEGVGSILDLLTAQAALESARAEDVRARADLLVAVARLARASGRLELPPPPQPDAAPIPEESPAP